MRQIAWLVIGRRLWQVFLKGKSEIVLFTTPRACLNLLVLFALRALCVRLFLCGRNSFSSLRVSDHVVSLLRHAPLDPPFVALV